MKVMMYFFIGFLFLTSIALAVQTASSESAWEKYQGVSQWSVAVTEDETGCGGGSKTHSRSVQLQHNQKSVGVGNWGHGQTKGTLGGNTLSMPERTIPDEGGTSKLHAFNIEFTPDCSGFAGSYRWDYRGSGQSCSGSTALRGTRTDGASCPQKSLRTEVNEYRIELNKILALRKEEKELAHKALLLSIENIDNEESPMLKKLNEKRNQNINKIDSLQPKVESSYRKILNKDPDNFWANWDMAELEKSKGNYKAYFDHFDRAASTLDTNTNNVMKKKVANDLGLSEFPEIVRSPIVKKISDDAHNFEGRSIYDILVKKDDLSNWEKFKMKLQAVFDSKNFVHNAVNEIVGLPPETK